MHNIHLSTIALLRRNRMDGFDISTSNIDRIREGKEKFAKLIKVSEKSKFKYTIHSLFTIYSIVFIYYSIYL